jgi:hypothetical protein
MMVGFLEWVRPAAGNYKLCCRMARVIRRVIDHLFEPALEQQVDNGPISVETETEIVPVDGLDDLDWLNSIDWSRGPFGDLDWLNNVDFAQSQEGELGYS